MSTNLQKAVPEVSLSVEKDIAILNASLEGEYFGIAAYEAAIGSGLLEASVRSVAKKFQSDHESHAERLHAVIVDLGGKPVETKTWDEYAADYPPPPLASQEDVLRYAASLESGGAAASVRSVSELSTPELARLSASIAGVEAMHWSVLLSALGEDPVPVSFIPVNGESPV